MWTTRVFSGASRSPSAWCRSPGHHQDKIIRVADELIIALAASPALLPLIWSSHLLAPFLVEMVIQHGEGSIRHQRREDPTLGRPCSCLFPVPEFREDPGFQERLYQRAGTLVLDPHPEAVHQCRMRDFVETGFDVGLEYPPVIDGLRCQVVDLGDRVMRTPVRAEPI